MYVRHQLEQATWNTSVYSPLNQCKALNSHCSNDGTSLRFVYVISGHSLSCSLGRNFRKVFRFCLQNRLKYFRLIVWHTFQSGKLSNSGRKAVSRIYQLCPSRNMGSSLLHMFDQRPFLLYIEPISLPCIVYSDIDREVFIGPFESSYHGKNLKITPFHDTQIGVAGIPAL
jgi:hypothetical protein